MVGGCGEGGSDVSSSVKQNKDRRPVSSKSERRYRRCMSGVEACQTADVGWVEVRDPGGALESYVLCRTPPDNTLSLTNFLGLPQDGYARLVCW